jgi:hypothetical protein
MTRNTKLYKISCIVDKKRQDVYYRDLTVLEYSYLSNIKNNIIKCEQAARTAIVKTDPDKIAIGPLLKIGEDVYNRTDSFLDPENHQLFEITISEFRESLKNDDIMILIKHILTCLPGQSFTDLIKLNIKDLVELVCMCEFMIGKPIFGAQKKHGLINKSTLPDDGKSLQEKMNALNSHLGVPK